MERAGSTPQVAADTTDLAELVAAPGPFLTVHLVTESEIDNAAQRSEQRWKPVRDEAATQGAPEAALAAVDPLVADAHLAGDGLIVVATPRGVATSSTAPAWPTTATWPAGRPCHRCCRRWPGARPPPGSSPCWPTARAPA